MVASDSSPVVSQPASNINERGALKGSARGAGKEERRETFSLLFSSLGPACELNREDWGRVSGSFNLKLRANTRTQHCWGLLRPFACSLTNTVCIYFNTTMVKEDVPAASDSIPRMKGTKNTALVQFEAFLPSLVHLSMNFIGPNDICFLTVITSYPCQVPQASLPLVRRVFQQVQGTHTTFCTFIQLF